MRPETEDLIRATLKRRASQARGEVILPDYESETRSMRSRNRMLAVAVASAVVVIVAGFLLAMRSTGDTETSVAADRTSAEASTTAEPSRTKSPRPERSETTGAEVTNCSKITFPKDVSDPDLVPNPERGQLTINYSGTIDGEYQNGSVTIDYANDPSCRENEETRYYLELVDLD